MEILHAEMGIVMYAPSDAYIVPDDDVLNLVGANFSACVRRSRMAQLSSVVADFLTPDCTEFPIGLELDQAFFDTLFGYLVAGISPQVCGINFTQITDVLLFADYMQMDELLKFAADCIKCRVIQFIDHNKHWPTTIEHEDDNDNDDFGCWCRALPRTFTHKKIPVRLLEKVFPYNSPGNVRIELLREWAPKDIDYVPDEASIKMISTIAYCEWVNVAIYTMNPDLLVWRRFKSV